MKSRKKTFWSKPKKIILGIILLLIIARIALPYVMLHYANKSLAKIDGYYGHIKDIDVALYRGAYRMDSFYLNKVSKDKTQTVFVRSDGIDLSLEWAALFKGKLVGELIFEKPLLRFTANETELEQVAKDTADFKKVLENFMPVKVNRCEIQKGTLQYIDESSKPKVDLVLTNTNGTATNLRNVYDKEETLPSDINLKALLYGGTFELNMKLNPLAQSAMFDINTEIKNMDMTQVNDFFKAYANFDVNKGAFSVFAEAATRKGKFNGYIKPLIKDLDVVSWKGQDKKDGFFQKLWETLVGAGGELFENQEKDQFATKVEFKGDLKDPKIDVFSAIVEVLRNAFVRSLMPTIDNEINLSTVETNKEKEKKGFFKAVFGKKDKD